MARGLDNDRETYDGFALENLHCFGCAHSAARTPWPGQPSGERPCGFCVRNPLRAVAMNNDNPAWYDGSKPVANPMDCYHSLDMQTQFSRWIKEAETNGAEALNRLIGLHSKMKAGERSGGH